jgi:hypothetical protein
MYVNSRINKSAGTILNDRLVPVPLLSHRFDYYGSTINNAISTSIPFLDTFILKKAELLQVRKETQKMWDAYKATYLAPEEDSVVKLADAEMIEVDQIIDDIYANSNNRIYADSLLNSSLREKAESVADKCNFLLDLQLRVGKEETEKMLSLVNIFGNFMVGAISLAMMLLGSIIYSSIRDKRDSKVVSKRPVKKPIKKPIKKAAAKK